MKTCIGNLIQINIKSHGFIYNVSTKSNRPFIHSIRNMEIAIDSKTNAKEFVEKIQWGRERYSSLKLLQRKQRLVPTESIIGSNAK